jgi:hypothetical protein
MQNHFVCIHLSSIITLVTITLEMTRPVQQPDVPAFGHNEQPDERDNEIVIELDPENQYGRTQPRANEPQGNHLRYTENCLSSLHAVNIIVNLKSQKSYS